jgi:3-hydroxyisobutyrate dehydrogenase
MSVIAFIGLGNMGIPMTTQLLTAGHDVRGYDLSADARSALVTAGGKGCDSPEQAVIGAELVILMLPNSAIVESVITAPTVLDALTPDALVIDMSSSEPTRTKALAAMLAKRSIRLIDAPVSGGVSGANKGSLTIMVGADDAELAEAIPVLSVLGTVKHAGPVGAGHAVKALNNLMSATHLLVTSEAILTGQSFGVDPELMLQIVNGSSGKSGSTENKWPNFILPGTYDSGFGLALMLKDMKIAVALADEVKVATPLSNAAVALWEEAATELSPTADHTEIARWVATAKRH